MLTVRLFVCPFDQYREGLTLHDVRYDGQDLFHRLSISDMTVPYGDPRAPLHRKQGASHCPVKPLASRHRLTSTRLLQLSIWESTSSVAVIEILALGPDVVPVLVALVQVTRPTDSASAAIVLVSFTISRPTYVISTDSHHSLPLADVLLNPSQAITSTGGVLHQENVVCMHEQDEGIGLKVCFASITLSKLFPEGLTLNTLPFLQHTNYRTNSPTVLRNRLLVVQQIITVANYGVTFVFFFSLQVKQG